MLLRQPALPRHDAGAQAALIPMTQGRGQPADDAPAPPARRPDWGVQAHWPALAALLPGLDVEVLASVGSTNTVLLERLRTVDARRGAGTTLGRRSGDRNPCLLVAERQTAGRGRRGRAWASPLAAHVYLSLARRFDGGIAGLQGLGLAVGVAACEALQALGYPQVGLKWPNDLLAEGRKLGGILVEVGGEAAGPLRVVVGLGLNVQMPASAARGIDQPWTDLAALSSRPPDRPAVAAALLAALVLALARFERAGLAPFLERWPRHDQLAGRAVRLEEGGRVHEGIAAGVAADGALRLRLADGERCFHAGEASLRAA